MTDYAAADALAANLASLRTQIPALAFMDTFNVQEPTPTEDTTGGETVTWGTVIAGVRGLLIPKQVTQGEGIGGGVALTETVYTGLLPCVMTDDDDNSIVLTTAHQLELVGSSRTFAITDVSTPGAVCVVIVAMLKESSR